MPPRGQDVEWGYAFDIHLNAFFPLLMILHFFQLPFLNGRFNYFVCYFYEIMLALNPFHYGEHISVVKYIVTVTVITMHVIQRCLQNFLEILR